MPSKKTKSEKNELREKCIASLRKKLKPGDTITIVPVESSDRGGWTAFDVLIPSRKLCHRTCKMKWQIESITWEVANVLGLPRSQKSGGAKVHGWGLRRSFEITYGLGRALFPKGFIPAKAGRTIGRNGTDPNLLDTDSGYALNEQVL
jgi:hypothetical protein